MLGLDNVCIGSLEEGRKCAPHDLVIASHVIGHVVDFDLVHMLHGFLKEGGLLYIEVPTRLHYDSAATER